MVMCFLCCVRNKIKIMEFLCLFLSFEIKLHQKIGFHDFSKIIFSFKFLLYIVIFKVLLIKFSEWLENQEKYLRAKLTPAKHPPNLVKFLYFTPTFLLKENSTWLDSNRLRIIYENINSIIIPSKHFLKQFFFLLLPLTLFYDDWHFWIASREAMI
jgi:hypothetical protein